MAFSIRKLSKRFFIISNLVVCAFFLLACLQPWLNPETFWLISFLSLTLPYLLLLVVAFLVFWFFMKIRYTLISIFCLMLGWKQVGVLFGTNSNTFSKARSEQTDLRLMTWNVKSLAGIGVATKSEQRKTAKDILALIKKYNPDIVCLQEFGVYDSPEKGADNLRSMQEMGYKHFVLSKDYSRVRYGYSSGLAIFSKLPIQAKKRIQFTSSPESLLYADVAIGKKLVRVFSAHLQSFKLMDKDFDRLESATSNGDNLVAASSNMFAKMKRAFRNRGSQVDQIRPYLDSTTSAELFCGDLNDVPGSYAYWQMRGFDRKDVFLEAGFGIGRTFTSIAPTLRIDYIFADPAWKVLQYTTVPTSLSDHLPVVADLKWQQ